MPRGLGAMWCAAGASLVRLVMSDRLDDHARVVARLVEGAQAGLLCDRTGMATGLSVIGCSACTVLRLRVGAILHRVAGSHTV